MSAWWLCDAREDLQRNVDGEEIPEENKEQRAEDKLEQRFGGIPCGPPGRRHHHAKEASPKWPHRWHIATPEPITSPSLLDARTQGLERTTCQQNRFFPPRTEVAT